MNKKYFSLLLIAAFLCCTVTSCGKDEVSPVSPVSPDSPDSSSGTSNEGNNKSGTSYGHGYVDMGVSVMWANCNVGASEPEEYGNYYAWGETKPKSEYTEENSATYRIEMDDFSGNPAYDAARANWGGTWRMPTESEVAELIDNTTTEGITLNGVEGVLVTSLINGNSIFLPHVGRYNGYTLQEGSFGRYWTSTPNHYNNSDVNHHDACYINVFTTGFEIEFSGRHFGLAVRAVFSEDDDNPYTPDTSKPETPNVPNEQNDTIREPVDMGLSVMWATCNIGALAPEDYGNYYAWGEIETKTEYSHATSLTYDKDMGDISGNPNYDVARAHWGSTWRMPTYDEWNELFGNSAIEANTLNGVGGLLLTSKINGNSIFLPCAGRYYMSSQSASNGTWGYYWTSKPSTNESAWCLSIYSDGWNIGFLESYREWIRYYGMSVRAVSD